MTVHFAAARNAASAPLARAFARRSTPEAANDNRDWHHDQLLRAALRHFAKHGLGAASDARAMAEQAFFAGDRETYRWWLGICQTLDRRLARQISAVALAEKAKPPA